jgi:hypothetical protein
MWAPRAAKVRATGGLDSLARDTKVHWGRREEGLLGEWVGGILRNG